MGVVEWYGKGGGEGVAKKVWGPFLETPDNFPGPVSIFSSSFIYQLMANIGPNLAICFTKT